MVSSFSMHEIISEMDVLHNYLTSDHFPLSMCIQIGAKDECPTGLDDDEKLIKFHKIEWDQLKPDVLSNYRQTTDSLLGDIELPDDIVDCSGVTATTTVILIVWVNCMGVLCTACQKLTMLVFQSERNAMFLLCLAGMITLRNHTKNLAKHIFFGAVITSLAQELFMSSWISPERGSNMLRIKCWRRKYFTCRCNGIKAC